jgi:hypothetical protein
MCRIRNSTLYFLFILSCSNGTNPLNDCESGSLSGLALYLAVSGKEGGVLKLDAETFERLAHRRFDLGEPTGISYIKEDQSLITIRAVGTGRSGLVYTLLRLNSDDLSTIDSLDNGFASFSSSVDGNYTITFLQKPGFQLIGPEFDVVYEYESTSYVIAATFHPVKPLLYFCHSPFPPSAYKGIIIFNFLEKTFVDTIPLDPIHENDMHVVQLLQAEDGGPLLVTAQNGGENFFYVVDPASKEFIKHRAGYYSKMAISPSRESVIITDPNGYYSEEFLPSHKAWTYNIAMETLNIEINGLPNVTDFVTFTPRFGNDDYTLFINGYFDTQGGTATLMQYCRNTKMATRFFSFPKDASGFVKSSVFTFDVGVK